MVVIGHQAVCVTDPTEPGDHTTQDIEELMTIAISLEDVPARITASRDMIQGPFVLDTQRSDHDESSLAGY
jgi:hypothetical protein